ncbi:MAG TPA: protein kinase [Ignavibacteriaceae bacterium]|nr:protein kinase [Ignavibacteriaceae bacterium]
MVPPKIDNYEIIEIIGEGGMGVVYKAIDLKLERYVAIKILNTSKPPNPQFIERFKREARNQAKLNHTNIIPVYGFTDVDNTLGIVMEYIEGETIEDILRREKRLELMFSLDVMRQALNGVAFAHQKGFIHRDLKPSNIIISNEGIAKIMDFGISKSVNDTKDITKAGTKIGTIFYMSPEQIRGKPPTTQSDLYSLGITFYEMLCGKTPFDYPTEFEIMEAHIKKMPTRLSDHLPNIPAEIDRIISKALEKSTAKRYQSANDFLDDINAVYEELSMVEPEKLEVYQDQRKASRHIIRKASFAAVLLALMSVLFYFFYSNISNLMKDDNQLIRSDNDENATYASTLGNNGVVHSEWIPVTLSTGTTLNSINFVDPLRGYVCGFNGLILKTDDGGKTWQKNTFDSGVNFFSVLFITPDKGFIAGDNGTLIYTEDGGKNWNFLKTFSKESVFDIYFLKDKLTGFMAGSHGTILKTVNGGRNWYPVYTPAKELLYSIGFKDERNGFAVGWNGTMLKTTNAGISWKLMDKITDNYLRDIIFIDESNGFISGGGGLVLRTTDGGQDWREIPSNTLSGLYSIHFVDNKDGLILGSRGEILVTDDSGANWKLTNSGNYTALTDAAIASRDQIFVVGFNGTMLTNRILQ